mmetsp:Transcript_20532/g.44494  ORF Transcript_20532/g.44494 Transcript_20532/m.44494 type:complete len:495 (+) Transcript_20532:1237-2721(+)
MDVVPRMKRLLPAVTLVLHIVIRNVDASRPTRRVVLLLREVNRRVLVLGEQSPPGGPADVRPALRPYFIHRGSSPAHVEEYRDRLPAQQHLSKEYVLRPAVPFGHAGIPDHEVAFDAVDAGAGERQLEGAHAALGEVGGDEDHAEAVEYWFHDSLKFHHVTLEKVISMTRSSTMPPQRDVKMIVRHHRPQQFPRQRQYALLVHPRHVLRFSISTLLDRIVAIGKLDSAVGILLLVPSVFVVDGTSYSFYQRSRLDEEGRYVRGVGLPGSRWEISGIDLPRPCHAVFVRIVVIVRSLFLFAEGNPIDRGTTDLLSLVVRFFRGMLLVVVVVELPIAVLLTYLLQFTTPRLPLCLPFVLGHLETYVGIRRKFVIVAVFVIVLFGRTQCRTFVGREIDHVQRMQSSARSVDVSQSSRFVISIVGVDAFHGGGVKSEDVVFVVVVVVSAGTATASSAPGTTAAGFGFLKTIHDSIVLDRPFGFGIDQYQYDGESGEYE